MSGSLPVAPADLLKDATKLKGDVQDLKTQAVATVSKVAAERANAEGQRDKAAEVRFSVMPSDMICYVKHSSTQLQHTQMVLKINTFFQMKGL